MWVKARVYASPGPARNLVGDADQHLDLVG